MVQWRKNNPEKQKVIKAKVQAKRRQLGFITLNESFKDYDGAEDSEDS